MLAINRRVARRKVVEAEGGVVAFPKNMDAPLGELLSKGRMELRRPRTGDNIHVSDLLSKCIRKKALLRRLGMQEPAQRVSLMDSLTYRQGDAIHDVLKERATAGGPGIVWGKWKCRCGALHVAEPCLNAEVDHSVICGNCDTGADYYEEVSFVHPEYRIVGHPDLLLYMKELSAFYVTELKSISAKQYEELIRPKPEHVLQVVFYWYVMRSLGMRMVDRVSILYATKGYEFRKSPYKEFTVVPSSELPRLNTYLEDAKAFNASLDGGELPVRTQCASQVSPDARACEVCKECFDTPTEKPIKVSYASLNSSAKKAPPRRRA